MKCESMVFMVWLAVNDQCLLTDFFILLFSSSPTTSRNYTECWMIDDGWYSLHLSWLHPAGTHCTVYYRVFKSAYAFIHKLVHAEVKLLCDHTKVEGKVRSRTGHEGPERK